MGTAGSSSKPKSRGDVVPCRPFRVLEAPWLLDDFYCSTLAYCPTSGILAVGLANKVYLWTDDLGVKQAPFNTEGKPNYVTSLSFSSENGRDSILAAGQRNGHLVLWSTFEATSRFEIVHPAGVSCVSFKPTTSRRLSTKANGMEADVEDLAVGDVFGDIWYYSVEWPGFDDYYWDGCRSIVLIGRISAHSEQICGLSWSPDSSFLASGGNDNYCMLFEISKIAPSRRHEKESEPHQSSRCSDVESQSPFSCSLSGTADSIRRFGRRNIVSQLLPFRPTGSLGPPTSRHSANAILSRGQSIVMPVNSQKHRLPHSAAVKAIAFAPWQPSLLATGGGANDHAVHFFHTQSGTRLASINVYAQVTSLIWSKTRPEIAVTLGYAEPQHPIRIAVFSWPSCEQVSAIPWGPYGSSIGDGINANMNDCGRALWAVSFPRCPYHWAPGPTEQETAVAGDMRRGRNESRTRKPLMTAVRPKEKEGGLWCSRTLEEGCIVVASSDQTVKFHEVWSGPPKRRTATVASGLLGGSGILEELEGIENPGKEIIR